LFARVPEVELERAVKVYSGLKMKLNNFRRQLESLKGLDSAMEDEWAPIRPEWTTVEKVLDSR
jgi:chromodomain-helicase-DNA-binding protein 4